MITEYTEHVQAAARQRPALTTPLTPEGLEARRPLPHAPRMRERELEERVSRLSDQLDATTCELDLFLYSVTHDLRAPLCGIDGWSQALLEDYDSQLDEQAHLYVNRIRADARRLGERIDALLALARLARADLRAEPVDLSALARTAADRLLERSPERSVEIAIQPGLSAHGDPRLLEVVLANLLDNAFKFTAKTPQARVAFGQAETRGRRAFFVSDNGAGFDMSFAKKLFGAFQRMHKESDFPGAGVGLATVRRLIHRHGGHVWAEAHVNQGATFYFTLEERTI